MLNSYVACDGAGQYHKSGGRLVFNYHLFNHNLLAWLSCIEFDECDSLSSARDLADVADGCDYYCTFKAVEVCNGRSFHMRHACHLRTTVRLAKCLTCAHKKQCSASIELASSIEALIALAIASAKWVLFNGG